MSDLSEQQWKDYLGLEHRCILWRALTDVRTAQGSLQVTDYQELYQTAGKLAEQIELKLKELYGETNNETIPS